MQPTPEVIAHRGLHATGARENTMAAFELALAAGAEMIELDVRRSGAGELAILHDHALSGVALDSCSLAEFERRTGLRPPLLAEVLGWAAGRIALDVELKEDGYAEAVAQALVGFIAAGGELLVTSFIDRLLRRLGELAPGLRLGLLLTLSARGGVRRALDAGAQVLLPEMRLVDERLLREAHEAGLEVIVWDFMASDHAWLLEDPRVRGVITDDVPGALEARGRARRGTLER